MEIRQQIEKLYKTHSGKQPELFLALPGSGSDRMYFRVGKPGQTVIAVYNPHRAENDAFCYMSGHFRNAGLPVPEILAVDQSGLFFLQTDLGDQNLFSLLEKCETPQQLKKLLIPAVEMLPRFQFQAAEGFDFNRCIGRKMFDAKAMHWDLSYFKYFFLKIKNIDFDEDLLEKDFERFTSVLSPVTFNTLMYRDFQSRNIMVHEGKYWYIDFQGAKAGPVQYDLVSLLYQAKARIDASTRNQLVDRYIESASPFSNFDDDAFRWLLPGFVLLRSLQVLGAYGFRGYIEKKQHFIQSIPLALQNVLQLLHQNPEFESYPELFRVLTLITAQIEPVIDIPAKTKILVVDVNSFSYKTGIPSDPFGNGGGFVFDCRFIPNPGRDPKYHALTGNDQPVIQYLDLQPAAQQLIQSAFLLVKPAVLNYLDRKFSHLMISFGCTGGQHRSVYCASRFAKLLTEQFPCIEVHLSHQNPEVKS